MWVWPQLVFGGSPPSPIVIGGPFPQAKPLPSPPSPSLFPHPPWLFLQGSGRGWRPQLGPFFVLNFVRSRGQISSTVSKGLSDSKVLFKHKNGR